MRRRTTSSSASRARPRMLYSPVWAGASGGAKRVAPGPLVRAEIGAYRGGITKESCLIGTDRAEHWPDDGEVLPCRGPTHMLEPWPIQPNACYWLRLPMITGSYT